MGLCMFRSSSKWSKKKTWKFNFLLWIDDLKEIRTLFFIGTSSNLFLKIFKCLMKKLALTFSCLKFAKLCRIFFLPKPLALADLHNLYFYLPSSNKWVFPNWKVRNTDIIGWIYNCLEVLIPCVSWKRFLWIIFFLV